MDYLFASNLGYGRYPDKTTKQVFCPHKTFLEIANKAKYSLHLQTIANNTLFSRDFYEGPYKAANQKSHPWNSHGWLVVMYHQSPVIRYL